MNSFEAIKQTMRQRLERDAMDLFSDMLAAGADPERASAEAAMFCAACNARNEAIVSLLKSGTATMAGLDWDSLDKAADDLQRKLDELKPRGKSLNWRRLS